MDESVAEQPIYLELGTIIQIEAPTNPNIHEKIYFIDYLDENQIRLVDTTTNDLLEIGIKDGFPSEESIELINILSNPNQVGYARQNNLIVGRGITIELGGDEPIIINGEITNLIEDMIEITTYPDKKLLYIDFAYKGIPLNIPIIEIRPFEIPASKETHEDEIFEDLEMTPEVDFDLDEATITQEKIKARRQEILVDADNIIFGNELGVVEQVVTVPEDEKRFSIKKQTNDLLDELLAVIPTNKRTNRVLNGIHTMIERYEQLREMFSKFDKEGLAIDIIKKSADYKPLVQSLVNLNKYLPWIRPIVRNRKKIYDVDMLSANATDDVIPRELSDVLTDENEIYEQYLSGDIPDDENKYYYLIKYLNRYVTPFSKTNDVQNLLIERVVNDNFSAIIDNLGDFYSGAVEGESSGKEVPGLIIRSRFINTRYTLGLTHLFYPDLKKTKLGPQTKTLTENNQIDIIGFLTFPEIFLQYSKINLPLTSILEKANLHQVNFFLHQFLLETTEIEKSIITQSDKNKNLVEKNFLKNFKEYTFEQDVKFEDRDIKTYSSFLNNIIPKTLNLFEMVRKYIKNDSSYYAIIKYLEPFLIYTNDITYTQYQQIVEYMREKIRQRKKIIVGSVPEFFKFINQISYNIPSLILPLVPSGGEINIEKIKELYGIKLTASYAVLRDIISLDGGRLFYDTLSLDMLTLGSSIDMGESLENELTDINKELFSEKPSKECSEFVLAKRYVELDELSADDDKEEVFFDKKYDPTRYEIMESFQEMKLMGDK